jgi:hypothetical protein
MNQGEEFRRYLGAVRKEFALSSGTHPSDDELIAYHRGELKEPEREKIQSHLVQCPQCIGIFRDVIAFFESSSEGDQLFREAELDRKWEDYRRRVQTKEQPPPPTSLRRSWFGQHPRVAFALAASLVIVAVTSLWALWLKRETRWQTKEKILTERVNELEQENRRRQDQTKILESQLAELRQPAVNAPVYDLLPRGAVLRAGGGSEVNRIAVPPTARNIILILHLAANRQHSSYKMEIVDQQGQLRWRGEDLLHPNSEGNFVITLDQTFLSQGRYYLKLYGQKENRSQLTAEYVISVE